MTAMTAAHESEQQRLAMDAARSDLQRVTLTLSLDHAGGASLVRSKANTLTFEQTDLVSLDIVHASNLQSLVFTQPAPTQRHLLLRACPRLTNIQGPLALDGQGAVVHISADDFSDDDGFSDGVHDGFGGVFASCDLHIDMPVTRIDASWQDSNGRTRTFAFDCGAQDAATQAAPTDETLSQQQGTAANPRYWKRVWVLSAKNLDSHPDLLTAATVHDLVIIDFDGYQAPLDGESNILSLSTNAELACLNLAHIDSLQVSGPTSLHVLGADSCLTKISTDSLRIFIDNIPELELLQPLPPQAQVNVSARDNNQSSSEVHTAGNTLSSSDACTEGNTKLLKLSECHSDALRIDIPVAHIMLKHCTSRSLTVHSCQILNIHSCPLIKRLSCEPLPIIELSGAVSNSLLEHARLSMNERIVQHNLAEIVSADDPKLGPLLNMVPMQLNGRDIYPALVVLNKAIELGMPIDQVWALRNHLNTNHLEHYKAGRKPRKSGLVADDVQAKCEPTQWLWKLRGDGSDEAWRIDFILWIHAFNANIGSAKRMRKLVGQRMGDHELARQAAAYVLHNEPNLLATATWLTLLKQIYKTHNRAFYAPDLYRHHSDTQKRFVHSLLSYATRLPTQEHELKRLAVDFVVMGYSVDTAEKLADKLFEIHSMHMRARCLELSREPEFHPTHLLDNELPRHTRYLKLALSKR